MWLLSLEFLCVVRPPVAPVDLYGASGALWQGGFEDKPEKNGKHDVQTVQHAG